MHLLNTVVECNALDHALRQERSTAWYSDQHKEKHCTNTGLHSHDFWWNTWFKQGETQGTHTFSWTARWACWWNQTPPWSPVCRHLWGKKHHLSSYQFTLFGASLEPGDTCPGNDRFTAHSLTQYTHVDIKGNWMLFKALVFSFSVRGGDIAQLVRASDHHAADAGSIPQRSKGFFSHSQLSVKTPWRVSIHPPRCNRLH